MGYFASFEESGESRGRGGGFNGVFVNVLLKAKQVCSKKKSRQVFPLGFAVPHTSDGFM